MDELQAAHDVVDVWRDLDNEDRGAIWEISAELHERLRDLAAATPKLD